MLEQDLVLKSGELYLVGNTPTDGSRERATGLYLRDTRHLALFRATVNGVRMERLSAFPHDAAHGVIVSANPHMRCTTGEIIPAQHILLEESIKLDDRMYVTIALQNFHRAEVQLALQLEMASDFRDLFDIRGFPRDERGTYCRPRVRKNEVTLGYKGLDGLIAETKFVFDREPIIKLRMITEDTADGILTIVPGTEEQTVEHEAIKLHEVLACFEMTLKPHERWLLTTEVVPIPATGPAVVGTVPRESAPAAIWSDNRIFNKLLVRSRQDLDALQTSFPEGSLPAAGIPWYVAPFGRDSLITGLQTLALYPERAIGTLKVLASLQGTRIDSVREEEPGKILHEMRHGEMARLRMVPHSPYYGSIDATPLWIWLFAETIAWTGNENLYRELLPNAKLAVEWIDAYGDLDGDGLVEYRGTAQDFGHISNQVWKDSYDSLNHADGTPAHGPVAAVEVQGYVYAGLKKLSEVAATFGDADWSKALAARAEVIRSTVEGSFWLPTQEFYAQALDGDKRPVAVLTSNPGHLLMCGLPARDRAECLTKRMLQSDLDSGRGIRTLSSEAATYNPMSYHNGSIWPHDNSMLGAGFYRYRFWEAGHAVATALFDVAQDEDLFRLPELYCGFGRHGNFEQQPIGYPVSCSPQAWAAGAVPLIVTSMLGMEVDLANRRLAISPSLPKWLDELTIHDLAVLGSRGTLTVRRSGMGYSVDAVALPLQSPERARA
jgi:glycogen debranching enzyme